MEDEQKSLSKEKTKDIITNLKFDYFLIKLFDNLSKKNTRYDKI